ncbi:MAG: hypothetical protein F6J87_29970, partial [Spirulina sp. SIO3F2]|nr:hypothetical protein [Spirulina sp. SIO3F2]
MTTKPPSRITPESPLRLNKLTPLQQTVISQKWRGDAQIIRLTTTPATPPAHWSIRTQLQRRDRGWRLVLFWIITTICVLGSFAIGGMWLVQRRPEPSCQSMPPMSSTSERLYCQELARSEERRAEARVKM